MATKKKADEVRTDSSLSAAAAQYRTAAGLGERTDNAPSDPARHESGGTTGTDEELQVTGPAKAGVEDKTQTSKAKEIKEPRGGE